MPSLPCFLCGNNLEKRLSKNHKPYFVCDACGTQFFVRRQAGIERLETLMRTAEANAIPFRQHSARLFEVQAILGDIDGTKAQIKKVEGEIGFLFPDDDKVRAVELLRTRLQTLFGELEEAVRKTN